MSSVVDILQSKSLIQTPSFFKNNVHYEVIMGSFAYGVSGDSSDCDVYGFVIPPKDIVFPHLKGEIQGFGRQTQKFEVWQQHHIKDKDSSKEYDLAIYNIVKFFQLCMENNPNMIDSLFVPQRCVLHCTQAAQMVRDNRKMFLHKGFGIKAKSYAFSQLSKARNKFRVSKEIFDFEETYGISHDISLEEAENDKILQCTDVSKINKYIKNLKLLLESGHKRAQEVRKTNFDRKFCYHILRLLNEAEQVLMEGDLDLERNREQLKSIRKGEWTFDQIVSYFDQKERELESLYTTSKLQHSPDENAIKNLLLNVLEHHYGSLNGIIERPNTTQSIIEDLEKVLQKYRGY